MDTYPVEEHGHHHHDKHGGGGHHGDHHHEKHGHHHHSNTLWWVTCIGCFVVMAIVIMAIGFAYWYRVDVNTATISNLAHKQQQLIQSSNKDISQWNDLRNIYSQESSSSSNRLSLCYSNIYYTKYDRQNASLEEIENYYDHVGIPGGSVVSKRRMEDKKIVRTTNDYYYYSLKASLSIEFNVDLEKLIKNGNDLARLKATKRPFMSIQSDITSNYHHFSTIKLLELGLDAQTRLLRQTHDPIILCSNNPYLKEVPCYDEEAPLLSVKYVKVTAMSHLSSTMNGGGGNDQDDDETHDLVYDKEKGHGVTTDDGVDRKKKNDTSLTYEMSLSQHKHGSDIYKLKGLIEGLRIYSILFYKEDTTKTTGGDQDERKQELLYKELITLSVNPNKCN